MDEGAVGDFPDTPSGLKGDRIELQTGMALRWRGELGWGRAVHETVEDFGCPEIDPILPLSYTGDVDFYAFDHQGGPLCLSLRSSLQPIPAGMSAALECDDPMSPEWELPLWRFDEERRCATGAWLNRDILGEASQGGEPPVYPEWVTDGPLFFGFLEPGAYTGMVAAICGRYGPATPGNCGGPDGVECVPYSIVAARVGSPEACRAFHDSMAEGAR
ncbi:MAG: hypothetical protein KTR31_25890 [Myxococcales bacterium]|nr:hypothetical protein [Myxococcales bacterium]